MIPAVPRDVEPAKATNNLITSRLGFSENFDCCLSITMSNSKIDNLVSQTLVLIQPLDYESVTCCCLLFFLPNYRLFDSFKQNVTQLTIEESEYEL